MALYTPARRPSRLQLFKTIWLAIIACFITGNVGAQVTITPNQTAAALAQMLTGQGVVVLNPTLNCPTSANGLFTVITSNLALDSGIILTTGTAATGLGNTGANSSAATFASTINNSAGDLDLNNLGSTTTGDACILEFDFVPAGDTVKFDYIFASEEYPEFACSGYNDVFGFFISGPGIVGNPNIALVPGTSVPVAINSVNSAPVGTSYSVSTCNAMGTGAPFNNYYINNSTSTTITYDGTTVVFQAVSEVIPCDTFHLKLAIADGGDQSFDSGVFLKAGSLTSNAVNVEPVGGGGGLSAPVPYAVRGCAPGQFRFTRPQAKPDSMIIRYQIAGSAVNGVDYATIPDSIIIAANSTTSTLLINPLPLPPQGPKTVKLYIYSPYTCGANTPIIDSAELVIFDSLQMRILQPDTVLCQGQSVQLTTEGDTLLKYQWSPAAGLNNATHRNPIATPGATTTYTVTASLPGSGCAPIQRSVTTTVRVRPTVNAGPDRVTCLNTPITLNASAGPNNQPHTYSWSPAGGLNNATLLQPTYTPATIHGNIPFVLTVNSDAVNCAGRDTVMIRVLPGDITLHNSDTAICAGAGVQIVLTGDPAFSYQWTPATDVSNPTIVNPLITPDTSRTYTVTASFPNCPNIVKSLHIDVQPNPIVFAGPDREKCQWDTLQLHGSVSPGWYQHYSFAWTPTNNIDYPDQADIVFFGEQDETMVLTVTTPAGCTGTDNAFITVHQGNFAALTPADTGLCPRDSVMLQATGGVFYEWTPGLYLTDSGIANPVSHPLNNIGYTAYVTNQWGCKDTLDVYLTVHPDAMLELGDSVLLYPGESYQMQPVGNVLYYDWFPPLGLSSANIANPLAQPDVNTRYFVTARTEWGCVTRDSIDVHVVPESILDMPNAFSPGSEPNGSFKINRRGIASLNYFRIFNRWGVQVFETRDVDQGWDGRFNGVAQPMGVYVYIVEAYTNTGRKVSKQGNVTLIR